MLAVGAASRIAAGQPAKARPGRAKPNVERNKLVEMAAMDVVTAHYAALGYDVTWVHNENKGWDIEARSGRTELWIEVKGLSLANQAIELTPNEYRAFSSLDPRYRLAIVSQALSDSPKLAIVMIGTNNCGDNSAGEIAAGIEAIVKTLRAKLPDTRILVLAIFPRGQKPYATRAKVDDVNRLLARLDDRDDVTFLDIGAKFLAPDGSISPDVMYDFLHPTAKGYEIWTAAMAPALDRLLADR